MNPGTILTTVGAAALGVGIIIGGTTAPNVLAQEAPSAAESAVPASEATREARFAEAYDRFVATLASELNRDEAAVDTAIRTALKEQVAALESDGRLDAGQVAEIQQAIDKSEVPFGSGFGGRGGMYRFGGHDGGNRGQGSDHRGSRGDLGERGQPGLEAPDAPAPELAPATLPSAKTSSDQSAPIDPAPAANDTAF